MDMAKTLPTKGQLERQLSQGVQALYRSQFGHLPHKVVCHLFADKIAIIAEGTITVLEQILKDNSQSDLASEIRAVVSETFAIEVKQKITEIFDLEVVDLIYDSNLDSGYLGAIAFLERTPQTRLAKKERYQDKNIILK